MVQVTVGYQERAEQVAYRVYGSGDAQYVQAIFFANPTLRYADALILPEGTVLEVPNPIPPDYNERATVVNTELAYMFDLLNGTQTPTPPATPYTGYRTTAGALPVDYSATDYSSTDYRTA